ncbi:hypothetical protein QBC39DRAFT_361925 [Podospora conica]|nr:hypothetical protein QBC39DRAFT_361925 [Schizothecium conicum]
MSLILPEQETSMESSTGVPFEFDEMYNKVKGLPSPAISFVLDEDPAARHLNCFVAEETNQAVDGGSVSAWTDLEHDHVDDEGELHPRAWTSPYSPDFVARICYIFRYDKKMLARLALVHKDWTRVARAYQFADVLLDLSPRSLSLLQRLRDEEAFRDPVHPQSRARLDEMMDASYVDTFILRTRPMIGPHIRVLRVHPSVATLDGALHKMAGDMFLQKLKGLPADANENDRANFNAWSDGPLDLEAVGDQLNEYVYRPKFRKLIQVVLDRCVPNMTAFECSDPLVFGKHAAIGLHHVLLKHQALQHLYLHDMSCMVPKAATAASDRRFRDRRFRRFPQNETAYRQEHDWRVLLGTDDLIGQVRPGRLETLFFDVHVEKGSASDQFMAVVAPSQHTLKTLRIVPGHSTITFDKFGEKLDRLRPVSLDLSEACHLLRDMRTFPATCFDDSAWSQLLVPTLEFLGFPDPRDHGFKKALAATPNLPRLKSVVAGDGVGRSASKYCRGSPPGASEEFLARHADQIESLLLGSTTVRSFGVVFSDPGRWSRLTSLKLAIRPLGSDISDGPPESPDSASLSRDVIMALGNLTALETLYLSVSPGKMWQHQWTPDHAVIRTHFTRLTKLKTLVFLLDTYPDMPGYNRSEANPDQPGFNRRDFAKVAAGVDEMMMDDSLVDPSFQHGGYSDLMARPDEGTEARHKYNMGKEAEDYAWLLPSLEKIVCGQRFHGITRERFPGLRKREWPRAYFVYFGEKQDIWDMFRSRPGRDRCELVDGDLVWNGGRKFF